MFGKGLQRTPRTRKYFMGKHREVNGFLYKIQRAITLMRGHESRNLYIKARDLNNWRCHIKLRSQPLPRAPIIKLFCESNLPVLSRPFYTSRTPKTRKQNNSTFCSCKSYIFQRHSWGMQQPLLCTLCSHKKWHVWFPWMDSHDLSTSR